MKMRQKLALMLNFLNLKSANGFEIVDPMSILKQSDETDAPSDPETETDTETDTKDS